MIIINAHANKDDYRKLLVQTFFDARSSCIDADRLAQDILAKNFLQTLLQRFQFGKIVHNKHILIGGVRCHLYQFTLVGIFDSYSINSDTRSTEISCCCAHIVLRFTVCDNHHHLLDALILPAPFLLGENLLLGKLEGCSSVCTTSAVRQDFDELQQFIPVIEGVEVELCCGPVVVHHYTHSDFAQTDFQAAHDRVQESADQLEIGGSDASRLVNNEHDVCQTGCFAICERSV